MPNSASGRLNPLRAMRLTLCFGRSRRFLTAPCRFLSQPAFRPLTGGWQKSTGSRALSNTPSPTRIKTQCLSHKENRPAGGEILIENGMCVATTCGTPTRLRTPHSQGLTPEIGGLATMPCRKIVCVESDLSGEIPQIRPDPTGWQRTGPGRPCLARRLRARMWADDRWVPIQRRFFRMGRGPACER